MIFIECADLTYSITLNRQYMKNFNITKYKNALYFFIYFSWYSQITRVDMP